MEKLYGSFAAKFVAVILLCCMALAFIGSAIGAAVVVERGGYTGNIRNVEESFYESLCQRMTSQVGRAWSEGQLYEGSRKEGLYTANGAFWYEIQDQDGETILSNYEGGAFLWEVVQVFEPYYSILWTADESGKGDRLEETWDGDITVVTPTPQPTVEPAIVPAPATPQPTETPAAVTIRYGRTGERVSFASEEEEWAWIRANTVTVRGYLPDPLPGSFPEGQELEMLRVLFRWRFELLWAVGLSFLLGVLLFIFLLRAAGHRKGTDAVVPSFVEKIPFDLFTLLSFCAIYVCLVPLAGGWDWPEILFVLIPCVLAAGLLFLLWCMSFAVRVKMRTLWKSCLLVRFCSWIVRGVRSVFRNLPILWKWIVGIVAAALIDLIFRMNAVWSENRAAFFWALFWLLAGLATLYAVLSFRRLRRGAAAIARGDYSTKIDSRHMIGDMKAHAADLEHIRDGIDLAVEERMKSERFRTELITNVSHDIKTPLTSIVNYVDLLAREEPQTDKQREYIEVLSRQSAKLKKLIGDLIEASKASTGDLPVDLQELDLSVLLDQTAGEYGERIADAGLELVLKKPEDPVKVMADGKHLWRIFDNLLNNVVKYAQPGTRVYLTLEERGNKAVLSFRNISREPLDVSGAELVERFVRGDSSRNTEGSGLGLSIAMSLTRLQKGAMAVAVDGDLFKVTLSFDKV